MGNVAKPRLVKYTGAWSHSKLRDFESCRAQFKRKHIEKLPEPESEALKRGSQVHDGIERWLKGWFKPAEKKTLLAMMGAMVPDFEKLKKLQPVGEEMWSFAQGFVPLADPWDKRAWVRAKTDAFLRETKVATVFDWKTGKPKEIDLDQLRFYGMLTLLRDPEIDVAKLELWYVDHNKIVQGAFERKDLAHAQKEFTRRASRIYSESRWPEEPGLGCRWCPFRRAVGGPCAF